MAHDHTELIRDLEDEPPTPSAAHQAAKAIRELERENADWNELFAAVTMGGLTDEFKSLANIKAIWPNDWHQDCAATAFFIKRLLDDNKALSAALSEAKEDAERYRWLRDSANYPDPDWCANNFDKFEREMLDAAIDAALVKEK